MKTWNIALAKAQFTEVIASSLSEPQFISNQDQEVAVVMNVTLFRKLMEEEEKQEKPTIKELMAELKEINEEEDDDFSLVNRQNRITGMEELNEVAL